MKAEHMKDGDLLVSISRQRWIIAVCLSALMVNVSGKKTWSTWFDVRPLMDLANQTVDTVDTVRQVLRYECPTVNIMEAQCRRKENITWPGDLCNISGVLCALDDLSALLNCVDYEVRFLCYAEDTTQAQTTLENPLSVNGGFIAMAAGLSVVVPLICVLIIQLRRAKRDERERRRAAEGSGGDNGGDSGQSNDSPPSYEQLFGPNYQATTPLHSRNSSMDVLLDENETRRSTPAATTARNVGAADADGGDVSLQTSIDGAYSNPSFLSTSVATISGSRVSDSPTSSVMLGGSASAFTSSESQPHPGYSSNSEASSSIGHLLLSNHPPSSSSHIPSTSTALPPPPPPPPPPPVPRSPPPPFSSWSNRRNSNRTGPSTIQQTLRRLPGMHISIEDFFASLRDLQDNDGPPPSYEEALKMLDSAKLAKENVHIIK